MRSPAQDDFLKLGERLPPFISKRIHVTDTCAWYFITTVRNGARLCISTGTVTASHKPG